MAELRIAGSGGHSWTLLERQPQLAQGARRLRERRETVDMYGIGHLLSSWWAGGFGTIKPNSVILNSRQDDIVRTRRAI